MKSRLVSLWDQVRPKRLTKWARLWIVLCAVGWLVCVSVLAVRAHSQWQAEQDRGAASEAADFAGLAADLAATHGARLLDPFSSEITLFLSDGTARRFSSSLSEAEVDQAMERAEAAASKIANQRVTGERMILTSVGPDVVLVVVNASEVAEVRRYLTSAEADSWERYEDGLQATRTAERRITQEFREGTFATALAAVVLFFLAMAARSAWRWIKRGA